MPLEQRGLDWIQRGELAEQEVLGQVLLPDQYQIMAVLEEVAVEVLQQQLQAQELPVALVQPITMVHLQPALLGQLVLLV